jgi:mono/diheme cytochrome c family protein
MEVTLKPMRSTLTAALTLALAGTLFARATPPPTAEARSADRVKRGAYLVTIAGCADCHSPKVDAQMTPDASRPLSGRPVTTAPPLQATGEIKASLDLTAWAGPWGNSYAANLTPDPETGLGGRYTEESFVKTMRTGVKPEGEPMLPPMPWPAFRHMTDEDLKSVYAYLSSLKPVKNFVRAAPALTASR